MNVDDDKVQSLLRELDHPAPDMDVETIVGQARRRRPSGLRWAAGFVLAACVAGGAYAIPGSPVREWVHTAVRWAGGGRGSEAPSRAEGTDTGMSGIAVFPGSAMVIEFTSVQEAGAARVSLTDEARITVRAPKEAATFTSAADRLLIDNRGSSATFEIQIPRAAPLVEIRIAGTRVFLKRGSHAEAEGLAESSGPFTLPLTGSQP